MEMNLTKYDAARRALAEAHRIDEVMEIHDQAAAMQAYAGQAKDDQMVMWAKEIRLRAERKAGQMLKDMAASGERRVEGRRSKDNKKLPLLSDFNITAKESSDWQKVASMSDEAFAEMVRTPRKRGPKGPNAYKGPKGPTENQKAAFIRAVFDEGKPQAETISEITGHNYQSPPTAFRTIYNQEIGRRDGAVIDASTLSETAQEKLAAAIRQHTRALDQQFEERVRCEVLKRTEERLKWLDEKEAKADEIIRARKGVMPRATFLKILTCLHPDSRQATSEEKLAGAFDAFNGYELVLCRENEPAINTIKFPSTFAEAEALKRKVSGERKAKRDTKKVQPCQCAKGE